MKNLIFFGIGIFVIYGIIHDLSGNSDLIATLVTGLILLVTYFRQKSLSNDIPNQNSTEFLIDDRDRWEKMVFDDNETSNSTGHRQAKAENEINEANEIIDNYLNKNKDDD